MFYIKIPFSHVRMKQSEHAFREIRLVTLKLIWHGHKVQYEVNETIFSERTYEVPDLETVT